MSFPVFLMGVWFHDYVPLSLGSPRSQTWEKDVSVSCLFERWVHKALVNEWEMISGKEGNQERYVIELVIIGWLGPNSAAELCWIE